MMILVGVAFIAIALWIGMEAPTDIQLTISAVFLVGGVIILALAKIANDVANMRRDSGAGVGVEYSDASGVLSVKRTSFHDHTPIEHMSDGTFRVRGEEDRYASEGDVKSVITARRASPDLRPNPLPPSSHGSPHDRGRLHTSPIPAGQTGACR